MRIAMPIFDNKGKESEIAEHFGHVQYLAIYDSEKKDLSFVDVKNIEGCAPVESLEGHDVNAIYCFGMGMRAMEKCRNLNIKLKTGPFSTVKEVIENLNKIQDLQESCGH
jgi:predicted Fe-Mo cluster-binding NifX family protein